MAIFVFVLNKITIVSVFIVNIDGKLLFLTVLRQSKAKYQ